MRSILTQQGEYSRGVQSEAKKKGQQTLTCEFRQLNLLSSCIYIKYKNTPNIYKILVSSKPTQMQESIHPLEAEHILNTIRSEVNSLSKNGEKLIVVSTMIREQLTNHHLSIVVAMYNNGSLIKFMDSWIAYQKKHKRSQMQPIFMIFALASDCLLHFNQKFFKIYKTLNIQKNELPASQSFLSPTQIIRLKKYQQLLTNFLQLNANQGLEPYGKGVELNIFINQQLSKFMPENVFEEVIITWLRNEAMTLQTEIFKEKKYQNVGLCCKLHFEKDGVYEMDCNDHFNITFKQNGQSKLQFQKEGDPIRRIMTYYLNNRGGYLFAGISTVNKQGKVEQASGIAMTKERMLSTLNQIQNKIIVNIFPTDDEDQEEDDEEQKERINLFLAKQREEFKQIIKLSRTFNLSRHISLQFLNIYDRNTLLFCRNQKGEELYALRFKVKIGDPSEVYYIVNKKELPEAYIERQKPLAMIDYYNMVYLRLKNKANKKIETREPISHPLCLQNLKFLKFQPKKDDIGKDSDDDQ